MEACITMTVYMKTSLDRQHSRGSDRAVAFDKQFTAPPLAVSGLAEARTASLDHCMLHVS
jgi:hypothetical protein